MQEGGSGGFRRHGMMNVEAADAGAPADRALHYRMTMSGQGGGIEASLAEATACHGGSVRPRSCHPERSKGSFLPPTRMYQGRKDPSLRSDDSRERDGSWARMTGGGHRPELLPCRRGIAEYCEPMEPNRPTGFDNGLPRRYLGRRYRGAPMSGAAPGRARLRCVTHLR